KHLPEAETMSRPNNSWDRLTRSYGAEDKDQAAFNDAMNEYFEKDYDDAIEKFRKFLEEYPKSAHQHRVRYWLGRSLKQEGEDEEADQQFSLILAQAPLTYYGILASFASGKKVESFVDATLPEAVTNESFLNPRDSLR